MQENGLILILEHCSPPLLVTIYMDLVIREVTTPQGDHSYILAYANDFAQTKQSTQEEEIKYRIAKYSQNVGCMNRLLKDMNVPMYRRKLSRSFPKPY